MKSKETISKEIARIISENHISRGEDFSLCSDEALMRISDLFIESPLLAQAEGLSDVWHVISQTSVSESMPVMTDDKAMEAIRALLQRDFPGLLEEVPSR
jgi:hypothetical protein